MKGQWGKLVGWFVGTFIVSAALTFGLPLIGGGSWLPDQISREGAAIDDLFWALLWMSVVIFAIVAALVIYCMTHFVAEPGDLSDGAHIHGNAKLEMVWIVVPTIIVAIIAVVSYIVMEDNEIGLFDKARANDRAAASLVVDVRGFSFAWGFRYNDRDGESLMDEGAEPASELVLPVDTVTRFDVMACSGEERLGRIIEQRHRELQAGDRENEFAEIEPSLCERHWDLTTKEDQEEAEQRATDLFEARQARQDDELTKEQRALLDEQPRYHGDNQYIDVNHAFWVPEARLKVDAVAGLRTFVQWKATRVTGPNDDFQVVCAELCGTGHNGMRTQMCVVSKATFDWWVELSTDDRKDATCVNLRLLKCLDAQSDLDETVASLAKLTKSNPDARCDDAEEAVA